MKGQGYDGPEKIAKLEVLEMAWSLDFVASPKDQLRQMTFYMRSLIKIYIYDSKVIYLNTSLDSPTKCFQNQELLEYMSPI